MGNLRSAEGTARYKAYVESGGLKGGCRLCEKEPLKEFVNWKIVKNIWPYDKIAEIHDMLVPKRHADEHALSAEEWSEFQKIKTDYLHKNYEYLIEATHRKKSIPEHFHLHLIFAKE